MLHGVNTDNCLVKRPCLGFITNSQSWRLSENTGVSQKERSTLPMSSTITKLNRSFPKPCFSKSCSRYTPFALDRTELDLYQFLDGPGDGLLSYAPVPTTVYPFSINVLQSQTAMKPEAPVTRTLAGAGIGDMSELVNAVVERGQGGWGDVLVVPRSGGRV